MQGDFSTAIEMTMASPDNQPVRFQNSDGEKKRAVNICRLGAIQYGSERHTGTQSGAGEYAGESRQFQMHDFFLIYLY